MSVVIIGNGPSVLRRKMGNVIDTYDIVIRINCFEMFKYEQHIGTKTTIWAPDTETIWYGWMFPFIKIIKEVWVVSSANIYGRNAKWYHQNFKMMEDYIKHFNPYIPITVIPSSRAQRIERIMRGAFPSTGLTLVDYAVEKYGQVDIYGFDHFISANNYFDATIASNDPHKGQKEREFIERLIEEGKVKRL